MESPASRPIKVHDIVSGSEVLGETKFVASRRVKLVAEFVKRFGFQPVYIARAPGRVNLIGEHIDYCLFGVLPSAIDRDILIACAPSSIENGVIHVQNMDERFPSDDLKPQKLPSGSWDLHIDTSALSWTSYIKAAYHGVLARFYSGSTFDPIPRGASFLVSGSVPTGGGLSSSAALVVASSLAFLAVNNKIGDITQGELVEMAMENEKRVGVNSGGMDQAASILSDPSSGLYISFFPKLHASQTRIPRGTPETVFVIMNSMKTSNKRETAKYHYNLRVVETWVAARILARRLNIDVGDTEKIQLREVLSRWIGEDVASEDPHGESSVAQLKAGLEKMVSTVESLLGSDKTADGYTLKDMIMATGLSEGAFKELFLSSFEVEAERFHLYRRAKHVFEEALRVLQFREICLANSNRADNADKEGLPDNTNELVTSAQARLGALMDESHNSCNSLFDCSCPELNELQGLAKQAGAIGSRLTGAGWGGCTVSLVFKDHLDKFVAYIMERYPPYKALNQEGLAEVIFSTEPSPGASVYILRDVSTN
ncbi:galactokinase [Tulasnella sp. 418]|nr:galactokinase [Tulasnella sp. 418]